MRLNGSDPLKISEFPCSAGLAPPNLAISEHFAVRHQVPLAIGATMSNDETAQFAILEASQSGLTAVQTEALSALLSGKTTKGAAELVNVDHSTVHR